MSGTTHGSKVQCFRDSCVKSSPLEQVVSYLAESANIQQSHLAAPWPTSLDAPVICSPTTQDATMLEIPKRVEERWVKART